MLPLGDSVVQCLVEAQEAGVGDGDIAELLKPWDGADSVISALR